jgi:hypothetical protein
MGERKCTVEALVGKYYEYILEKSKGFHNRVHRTTGIMVN